MKIAHVLTGLGVAALVAHLYNAAVFSADENWTKTHEALPAITDVGNGNSFHANVYVITLTVFAVIVPIISAHLSDSRLSMLLALVGSLGVMALAAFENVAYPFHHSTSTLVGCGSLFAWIISIFMQQEFSPVVLSVALAMAGMFAYLFKIRGNHEVKARNNFAIGEYALLVMCISLVLYSLYTSPAPNYPFFSPK